MMPGRIGFALAILLPLAFTGCAPATLRRELANRGLLAVSEQNPYVAANQLLSYETAKSPVLRGFLEKEGAPDAIEVVHRFLETDLFYLYYLDREQRFDLSMHEKDWIINGPSKLSEEFLKNVRHFPQIHGKAALGTDATAAETPQPPVIVTGKSLTKPPLSQAKKSTKKLDVRKSEGLKGAASEKKTAAENASPASSPTKIEGDVIHPVSYPGETLRFIAEWYTGDPSNATRIARINDFSDANALQLGMTVRIPRYLLKRTDPMPQSAVKTSPPGGNEPATGAKSDASPSPTDQAPQTK